MKRIPKRAAAVVAAVAVVVVVWLVAFRRDGNPAVLVATGTVEGMEALVGFERAGQVAQVLVREGDVVGAGSVLAVLDTAALHARRLQAEAQVSVARALLRELDAGARPQEVVDATSASEAAAVKLQDARRDLERAATLYEGGVVSREALDKARTAAEVQERQFRQTAARADMVREGPRAERIAAQRAQLEQALASLAEIDAAVADAVLRAPFAGVVTVRHREPGEIVSPGAPAISLLDRSDRWIRIYVPENRLAAVRLGTPATISTDTYAEQRYHGEVSHIASAAEFTPKTVQTQEERVKLVYGAKVRITGDPEYQLKPGMPADVSIPLLTRTAAR